MVLGQKGHLCHCIDRHSEPVSCQTWENQEVESNGPKSYLCENSRASAQGRTFMVPCSASFIWAHELELLFFLFFFLPIFLFFFFKTGSLYYVLLAVLEL